MTSDASFCLTLLLSSQALDLPLIIFPDRGRRQVKSLLSSSAFPDGYTAYSCRGRLAVDRLCSRRTSCFPKRLCRERPEDRDHFAHNTDMLLRPEADQGIPLALILRLQP
jgi:hypothetical protein